ncbi:MAG TPA: hypothetical protein VJC17_04685 [Candidatus Dojkabacteria bacterium]|nr:hypothetical protein [Candidatus Dojkabacteria bacterium]
MNRQTKGSILVAFSAIFFGSYGLWAKLIGPDVGNFFQVYTRSLIILLLLVPIILVTKGYKKLL